MVYLIAKTYYVHMSYSTYFFRIVVTLTHSVLHIEPLLRARLEQMSLTVEMVVDTCILDGFNPLHHVRDVNNLGSPLETLLLFSAPLLLPRSCLVQHVKIKN